MSEAAIMEDWAVELMNSPRYQQEVYADMEDRLCEQADEICSLKQQLATANRNLHEAMAQLTQLTQRPPLNGRGMYDGFWINFEKSIVIDSIRYGEEDMLRGMGYVPWEEVKQKFKESKSA